MNHEKQAKYRLIKIENFERSDGKSSSRGGGFRRRVT